LAAVTCSPPLLDEEKLCVDFTNDGLICWGSQGEGMNGGMDTGVPWDSRSWEPQVWFLEKYWFLVGGYEDEMWRSAKWWCGMQGEKIDVGYAS
jgi:hypothetical protein